MEKSIKKLVYMLHQIMNDAGFALLHNEGEETRLFCVAQYNNIRSRLTELDVDLGAQFEPLSNKASVGMVRVAARDMAGQLIEYLQNRQNWSSMALLPGMMWLFSGIEQNG